MGMKVRVLYLTEISVRKLRYKEAAPVAGRHGVELKEVLFLLGYLL